MSEEYRLHLLELGRLYRKRGNLHPLVIIEGKDETLFLDVNQLWGEQDVRKALMYQLGLVGYGIDAQRIYALVDIWYRQDEVAPDTTEEEARAQAHKALLPSQDPKRRQALQCIELPKDEPEAITWQPYDGSIKRGFTWEEPHTWDQHFEDYTFGGFWHSVQDSESAAAALMNIWGAGPDFMFDTGLTADGHARRAARRLAFDRFGKILFGEEELARKARRWHRP